MAMLVNETSPVCDQYSNNPESSAGTEFHCFVCLLTTSIHNGTKSYGYIISNIEQTEHRQKN